MVDAVRTDRMPVSLEFLNCFERRAVDLPTDEEGGLDAKLIQQWQRLDPVLKVAVVKGEHHTAFGERFWCLDAARDVCQ